MSETLGWEQVIHPIVASRGNQCSVLEFLDAAILSLVVQRSRCLELLYILPLSPLLSLIVSMSMNHNRLMPQVLFFADFSKPVVTYSDSPSLFLFYFSPSPHVFLFLFLTSSSVPGIAHPICLPTWPFILQHPDAVLFLFHEQSRETLHKLLPLSPTGLSACFGLSTWYPAMLYWLACLPSCPSIQLCGENHTSKDCLYGTEHSTRHTAPARSCVSTLTLCKDKKSESP